MKNVVSALALLLLVACSRETTQQAHPRRFGAAPAPVMAPQDRDFLEQTVEGNNAEIAIGMLARVRATRPDLREYGAMLVRDHTALNMQLATIAKERNIALPSSLGDRQASYDHLADLHLQPFDDQFAQVMVEDHGLTLQRFQAEASGGVDPDLRAFAAATAPRIEAHLARAKSMAGAKPPLTH